MSETYQWAREFNESVKGVTINTGAVDPNDVGRLCKKIEGQQGDVSPDDLVEASRGKRSKTHKLFEWDDTKCGPRYRREQARLAMRMLHVRVVIKGDKEESIRLMHPVTKEDSRESSQVSLDVGMQNPAHRDQILQECLNELRRWRRKWHQLNEYASVFPLVDRAIDELRETVANAQ